MQTEIKKTYGNEHLSVWGTLGSLIYYDAFYMCVESVRNTMLEYVTLWSFS